MLVDHIWYHSVPSLRHGTGLGRLSVSSKTCRWYFEVESGCLVWLWANTNKTQEAYTQTHDIAHREYGSTQRQLPGSTGSTCGQKGNRPRGTLMMLDGFKDDRAPAGNLYARR